MRRTRLSAVLYLVLVFASGILVGIVSARLYTNTTASANTAPRSSEEWRKRYLDQMKKRVGVSDQQIASVSAILDDTRRKFDELKKSEQKVHDELYHEQLESIRALLNDQQKATFDQWRAERLKEKEKGKHGEKEKAAK